MFYRFKAVIIQRNDENNSFAAEIIHRLKKVNDRDFEVIVSDRPYASAEKQLTKAHDEILEGKQILILESYKGDLIKKCPGTDGFLCCNYYTLNIQKGCTIDCYYCILQEYLHNNPVISINLNIKGALQKLEEYAKTQKGLIRIGTGELTDSLHLEEITLAGKQLVEFFSRKENYLFELKTKSNSVESLLSISHNNRTVISWSVNPQAIIDELEPFSASLEQRLEAIQKVLHAGYKVGLHFDPLIMVEGWKNLYEDLIKQLCLIPDDKVAWFSIGALRFYLEIR
ncbi:MAG: hypothetical protein HQK84_09940, partial [Nitrospinae bacterium]|nr:hypothetical protein [Nitrospinota bacterium]